MGMCSIDLSRQNAESKINNALKGISECHSVNLLLKVLQIKAISTFAGIFTVRNGCKSLLLRGKSRKVRF